MYKRKSIEVKKEILKLLKSSKMSYAQLERKVNTGFRTIKSNCEELESYGFIEVKKIPKHPSNGKESFLISITAKGRDYIK
jgi:predicted transcriptional regulator